MEVQSISNAVVEYRMPLQLHVDAKSSSPQQQSSQSSKITQTVRMTSLLLSSTHVQYPMFRYNDRAADQFQVLSYCAQNPPRARKKNVCAIMNVCHQRRAARPELRSYVQVSIVVVALLSWRLSMVSRRGKSRRRTVQR